MIECRLSCIIRPNAAGTWFIQDDTDHYAKGFYSLDQHADRLELNFQSTYDKAGAIQISADDDFAGLLFAGGNLGLSSSRIKLRLAGNPMPIDPARVWDCLPYSTKEAGNLWVTATMWLNP